VLTRQHTHAPKKALPESTGCRVTKLAIRMSEHSIIKFHVCSKQVQKDSSPDAEEEQASSLREDRQTNAAAATKMWAAVALRGISKRHEGGGSPEGGHVLEGTAVHCSFVGDHLDG
jgi:hypothetical protein